MKNHRNKKALNKGKLTAAGLALIPILTLASPARIHAQEASDAPARPTTSTEKLKLLKAFADSMQLPSPYSREVFTYPRFNRTDPVIPPPSFIAKDEDAPTLFLSAIIHDPKNPKLSVAILRIGDRGGKQQRVSEGDRIGQIEIEKIEGNTVTLLIHGLGNKRRQVLEQSKPNK